jgi:hypothetical protein
LRGALQEIQERRRAEQELAEQQRTTADLDASLTRDELSAAGDLLSAATALNAADPRVSGARQRVEQAIAAREAADARARDLEEKNAAAEELFERGDLQGAMRLLTLAATLNPQHPGTVLLTERVAAAIAQREAADAADSLRRTIDELLAAAAEYLQSPEHKAHDATLAFGKITQALALDPGHAGALALKATAVTALIAQREAAFIAAAIRNARNRFAHGKHQAALQLLENLDASSAHPVIAETLKELRGALQEIQERRRAEQALAEQQRKTADLESGTRVLIPPHVQTGDPIQPAEAAGRPWRWGVIVAVGLLLLAILAALFLLSQPASASAPHETAGIAVFAPMPATAGATARPFV